MDFGGITCKGESHANEFRFQRNRDFDQNCYGALHRGSSLDKAVVEKAVTAGIPGLLAALASLVAKPGGAERSDAVAQEQPGILTNIANVLGGPQQGTIIDNGVDMLSSLLGGSTTSALTGAVGRLANVDKGESKT